MNLEMLMTSITSAGIGGVVVAWLLRMWVSERVTQSIRHEYALDLEKLKNDLESSRAVAFNVWSLRRDACMRALNVANAVLSNYKYENIQEQSLKPQFESIESVRACFNELACTCESPDVLNQLKQIMCESVSVDAIVDLRNAVRRELRFTAVEVDSDRTRAFMGKVNCEPSQGKRGN